MSRFYNPNGNIEVWDKKPEGYFTVDEWNALHPAPALLQLTPAEIKAQRIAALDSEYNSDKRELLMYIVEAQAIGDDDLAAELKLELAALNTAYDEALEGIENGIEN